MNTLLVAVITALSVNDSCSHSKQHSIQRLNCTFGYRSSDLKSTKPNLAFPRVFTQLNVTYPKKLTTLTCGCNNYEKDIN